MTAVQPHTMARLLNTSHRHDTEQVPLQKNGRIEVFFQRVGLPQVANAWIDWSSTKFKHIKRCL